MNDLFQSLDGKPMLSIGTEHRRPMGRSCNWIIITCRFQSIRVDTFDSNITYNGWWVHRQITDLRCKVNILVCQYKESDNYYFYSSVACCFSIISCSWDMDLPSLPPDTSPLFQAPEGYLYKVPWKLTVIDDVGMWVTRIDYRLNP